MRIILIAALLTAGCNGVPVRTEIKTINVPVPAPCPDKTIYTKLKSTRPSPPLRDLPMPASPEERVAKTAAQLGLYEREGGWADQVIAALDRCQVANP